MRVIANTKINITDEEYNYFLQLKDRFKDDNGNTGEKYFVSLFDTDEDGFITLIRTEKSIPWAVLFFVQQVMINQRMRLCDSLLDPAGKMLDRLDDLEKRMQAIESTNQPLGR